MDAESLSCPPVCDWCGFGSVSKTIDDAELCARCAAVAYPGYMEAYAHGQMGKVVVEGARDEALRETLFNMMVPHLPPEMGIGERYCLIGEIMDAVADYARDHRNDAFLEDPPAEAIAQIDDWVGASR